MGYPGYSGGGGGGFGGFGGYGQPSSPMQMYGGYPGGSSFQLDTNAGNTGAGGSGSTISSIGKWLASHPEALLMAGGLVTGYLGNRNAQQAAQQQQGISNEQWQQEFGLQQKQEGLNEKEFQSAQDAAAAEKVRRGAAIRQILGMDRTRVAPPAAPTT